MYSENKTLTPTCIIYVDGERLDWKYEGALESVKVSDRLNEAGTASLLFGMPAGEFDGGGAFSEGERGLSLPRLQGRHAGGVRGRGHGHLAPVR